MPTSRVKPQSWADGGASFNGGGAIQTAGPVVDTASSYTVSAWVKIPDAAGDYAAVTQRGSQASAFYLGYDTGPGRFRFGAYNADTANTGLTAATATSPPAVGSWVHLVGVRDQAAGRLNLYVDGVLQSSVVAPPAFATSGPLMIGGYQYNGCACYFAKGGIDNVQVYPKAITAAQVSALHGKGRDGASLSTYPTTSWTYDQRGLTITTTDPNGNITRTEYDEAGQPAISTAPAVVAEESGGTSALAVPVMSIGYNTFGEVVENKDAKGRVTTTVRDAAGQPTQVRLPAYTPPGSSTPISPVSKTEYDDAGSGDQDHRCAVARDGLRVRPARPGGAGHHAQRRPDQVHLFTQWRAAVGH
ncbi:LamG domain-containing protein [Allorhizocola rhizosphaerae]|uniref:LamG domain-containing protein n=1 Tax=Allorhizocola rhizosphaerae TaxID=1872709 RepID=UPI0013C36F50|nr:LamG-like jellyroll fold domain-containing protein [Allorhizocola rhizosphaerae]